MKDFVAERELLFKERKDNLYHALYPYIAYNKEALYLFSLIQNLSITGKEITYPLTNEYCERLLNSKCEQEIVSILIEIIDVQNEHDFVYFKDLLQNLEFSNADIFNYLRLATKNLDALEPNPYQPNVEFILKQIKRKRDEVQLTYNGAIEKIENWLNNNS